jgi:hypothetical protein
MKVVITAPNLTENIRLGWKGLSGNLDYSALS